MPWCDTCNAELPEGQGTMIDNAIVKKGIEAGFRPSSQWLQRRARLMQPPTAEAAEEAWLKIFTSSSTDHLLCDVCKNNLSRALNVLL